MEKGMVFRKEYFFLSNFYEGNIFEYKGMKFTNGEAAFQSQKCLERQKEFEMIKPDQAKRLGKNVQLRNDWEKEKDKIMYEVCYAKFSQDENLRNKLISTGDIELVEGNHHGDRIWGKTYCQKTMSWVGENKLGTNLMKIREDFLMESAKMIQMNNNLINKTVDDVISTVNFLCKEDLNMLALNSKLETLNNKMQDLQTLVVYSNDESFTKKVCAMQILNDNFNEEIERSSDKFSQEFKDTQLNFLQNISDAFNININEVENVDSMVKNDLNNEYKEKVENTKEEYKKETIKNTIEDIINASNERIDNYFNSEKDMKDYLRFMGKFHNYSIGNNALIQSQFPYANAVGSYKFWNDNGYRIKGKEKGIQILVPVEVKNFIDENGEKVGLYKATKEQKQKLKNGDLKYTQSGISYKKGHVYEISQTTATQEDLPKIYPNKWLEGEVKNYKHLYNSLVNVADHLDVEIVPPREELGVVKGVFYPLSKEVALNPRNSELQNVKTLLHELAHAKLHPFLKGQSYTKPEKEFQAEMVAFSVCSYFNIDTSDYSLAYLSNYTQGTDIKEKKHLLNEIKEASTMFIQTMEEQLKAEQKAEKLIEENKDLKIEGKNVLDNDTENQNISTINNVIDNKNKNYVSEYDNSNVYVKFLFSEYAGIEENSVYTFDDADKLLGTLTEIHHAKGYSGYDKTKFELHFNKECTDCFYEGRFDIGDGYAKDLRSHITQFITDYKDELNISDSKKNSYFSVLGLTDPSQNKKEKSLSLV